MCASRTMTPPASTRPRINFALAAVSPAQRRLLSAPMGWSAQISRRFVFSAAKFPPVAGIPIAAEFAI
ncbi:CG14958 [Drosophila busckii]|uniref:CG14958 n=1 Tax=Drosophila busckii TaxID=30019 RepID=A0A0M3QTY7_DROBS|nr:CG14958 [Drosophila busckii]